MNTRAVLEEELNRGEMPIFGIPLLGFRDYDPREVEAGQAMRHWHSVSQSNWKRMAYHVLGPRHKQQGSVIKQMLRQYWLNQAHADALLEDFTLGVNLADRARYHEIVERDGDFICVRFRDCQRPEGLSPKSEAVSPNVSKQKAINFSFQTRNKSSARTKINQVSPASKSSKLSIKSFRTFSAT